MDYDREPLWVPPPSMPNRVAVRLFDLTPPQRMSVLRVYGQPTDPACEPPRLLDLELDRDSGQLVAHYDPADLDAAARAFVEAAVEAWGPSLRAYLDQAGTAENRDGSPGSAVTV